MPCLRQYTRQAVLTEWASQDILTAFRPAAVRAQNPQTMTGFAYDDFSNTILTRKHQLYYQTLMRVFTVNGL